MKQYNPTMQDYIEIAKELQHIRNELVHMSVRISGTFGKTKMRKEGFDISNAYKTVDKARSKLEDKMFEDFPDEATTHIFYGASMYRGPKGGDLNDSP